MLVETDKLKKEKEDKASSPSDKAESKPETTQKQDHPLGDMIFEQLDTLNKLYEGKIRALETKIEAMQAEKKDQGQNTEILGRIEKLEKKIAKFIGLYEVVTNKFNPFVEEEPHHAHAETHILQASPMKAAEAVILAKPAPQTAHAEQVPKVEAKQEAIKEPLIKEQEPLQKKTPISENATPADKPAPPQTKTAEKLPEPKISFDPKERIAPAKDARIMQPHDEVKKEPNEANNQLESKSAEKHRQVGTPQLNPINKIAHDSIHGRPQSVVMKGARTITHPSGKPDKKAAAGAASLNGTMQQIKDAISQFYTLTHNDPAAMNDLKTNLREIVAEISLIDVETQGSDEVEHKVLELQNRIDSIKHKMEDNQPGLVKNALKKNNYDLWSTLDDLSSGRLK